MKGTRFIKKRKRNFPKGREGASDSYHTQAKTINIKNSDWQIVRQVQTELTSCPCTELCVSLYE